MNILVDGDSGESGSEHVSSVGVGFAEEGVVPSGLVESEVESADAGEEASDESKIRGKRSLIGFAVSIGRSSTM
jgi:hypothetical protein